MITPLKAHVPVHFIVTVYDADVRTVADFRKHLNGISTYTVGKVKPQNGPK